MIRAPTFTIRDNLKRHRFSEHIVEMGISIVLVFTRFNPEQAENSVFVPRKESIL